MEHMYNGILFTVVLFFIRSVNGKEIYQEPCNVTQECYHGLDCINNICDCPRGLVWAPQGYQYNCTSKNLSLDIKVKKFVKKVKIVCVVQATYDVSMTVTDGREIKNNLLVHLNETNNHHAYSLMSYRYNYKQNFSCSAAMLFNPAIRKKVTKFIYFERPHGTLCSVSEECKQGLVCKNRRCSCPYGLVWSVIGCVRPDITLNIAHTRDDGKLTLTCSVEAIFSLEITWLCKDTSTRSVIVNLTPNNRKFTHTVSFYPLPSITMKCSCIVDSLENKNISATQTIIIPHSRIKKIDYYQYLIMIAVVIGVCSICMGVVHFARRRERYMNRGIIASDYYDSQEITRTDRPPSYDFFLKNIQTPPPDYQEVTFFRRGPSHEEKEETLLRSNASGERRASFRRPNSRTSGASNLTYIPESKCSPNVLY